MIRLVLTILVLALMPVSFSRAQTTDQRATWNRPVAPFQIEGDLYYVGVEGVGAFLVTTSDGLILIDGALPESAPRIVESIRALGFDPAQVKVLLNTHAHFDHAGGLAELRAETGAMLVASAGDRPALEAGRHFGLADYGIGRFPPVPVDRVIGDGETVRLGDTVLTAHVTPGHTAGCTTWTLPVRSRGRTLTVAIYCSTTVAGARLVGNTEYPGIVADFRHSFDVLEHLPADVFVANHPGFSNLFEQHRRRLAGEADAHVDPQALPRFVRRSREAFEVELARQRREAGR